MDVVIAQGRKIVSDEVRALTEEKVGRLGHRCPGLERAEVHFSEEHNPRIADRECCEVIIDGHGRTIRARAAAPAPLVAVDLVVEKLEHQLEKTKGRLVARTHPRRRPANSVTVYRSGCAPPEHGPAPGPDRRSGSQLTPAGGEAPGDRDVRR